MVHSGYSRVVQTSPELENSGSDRAGPSFDSTMSYENIVDPRTGRKTDPEQTCFLEKECNRKKVPNESLLTRISAYTRTLTQRRGFLAAVSTLSVLLALGGATVVFVVNGWWPHLPKLHTPQLSLDELLNGTYSQRTSSVNWLENGLYTEVTSQGVELKHWGSQPGIEPRIITPLTIPYNGSSHFVEGVSLNQDQTHVLMKTGGEKHWRHSSYANFWVMPAGSDAQNATMLREGKISIAQWSPNGETIAYVFEHNIYLYHLNSRKTQQITNDGDTNVYNGVPDWVYEEEVVAGDSVMWWSPKGAYLAYMRTDDTNVSSYPVPYFLSKAHDFDAAQGHPDALSKIDPNNPGSYPSVVELKYPKSGFANPVVELWMYQLDTKKPYRVNIQTDLSEPIIFQVFWVGEQALVEIVDRVSDHWEVWVVDPETQDDAYRSRAYDSKDHSNKWFDVSHRAVAIKNDGYIDRMDINGYNHLVYFSPANASDPKILTRGDWEVTNHAIAVNEDKGLVFFQGAKQSALDLNLYYISIHNPHAEPEPLACQAEFGMNQATFARDGSYATVTSSTLNSTTNQSVIKLPTEFKRNSAGTCYPLIDNEALGSQLASKGLLDPDLVHTGILDLGNNISVNYREVRPTNFHPHRKYPLLFYNYGGPDSKILYNSLPLGFERVYAEAHDAIVVTIEPRGTANRGREFGAVVRDHLGVKEADDVISAAKLYNSYPYIDETATAIWGWSYGGFLTLKVLERDEDLAFKYGLAVAPVTDWALYDSVYVERYMHTPQTNPDGYAASAVTNMTNFPRHERFMIMHGSGDDNVHVQHTLEFVDRLDLANVENYDMHIFPDSDHSISFHNAYRMVMQRVDSWISSHQRSRKRH